jgi:RNA polymerase sigma-70 factor (ECF subfamily)
MYSYSFKPLCAALRLMTFLLVQVLHVEIQGRFKFGVTLLPQSSYYPLVGQENGERASDTAAWAEAVRAWLNQRDESAARLLMTGLYPLVISIIRARLPNRTAEEDLAQEVFVRFFERLDRYDGRAPLSHWVARLTTNLCIDQLRAEKRRPELRWADLTEAQMEALEAVLVADAKPPETGTAGELAARLLETLSPKDRLVIQMLDLEGCTSTEVEQVTGWNSVTIRVRAFRARRKLRKELQKLEQMKCTT